VNRFAQGHFAVGHLCLEIGERNRKILRNVQGSDELPLVLEPEKGVGHRRVRRKQAGQPIAKLGIAIDPVFNTIPDIFAPIMAIFTLVTAVFAAVGSASVSTCVAYVFPAIAYIFGPVTDVFPAVPDIFTPVLNGRPSLRGCSGLRPPGLAQQSWSTKRQGQTGSQYKRHVFHCELSFQI
jgi:hypothetical protein